MITSDSIESFDESKRAFQAEIKIPTGSDEKSKYQRSPSNDIELCPRVSSAPMKTITSPYLQKLSRSCFIQAIPSNPSTATRRCSYSERRSLNEPFGNGHDVLTGSFLDLKTFENMKRTTSAPNRRAKAIRKRKLRSQSQTFRIRIYRNGDHERSVHCTLTNLHAIFQYATIKLQMPLAARRLFDSTGQEIHRMEEIRTRQDYYVSSGENFKDPFEFIRTQVEYGVNSKWTMKGIQTDIEKPESFKTKPVISKRLDDQIQQSFVLIIIENGSESKDGAHQILIDSVLRRKFQRFLEECTKKLSLTSHATRAFTYCGVEMKSLKNFFSAENRIDTATMGQIYGPLWLSHGEQFRPASAYYYLNYQHRLYDKEISRVERELKFLRQLMQRKRRNDSSDDESSPKILTKQQRDKSLASLTKTEMKEHEQKLILELDELRRQQDVWLARKQSIEDEAKPTSEFFVNENIKLVDFNDKIVGKHPLRLFIHQNGVCHRTDPKIYLNLRILPSKSVKQTPIEYLLRYLQETIEIYARQRPKRVFDIDGNELSNIGQLKHDQHIFISFGEDYRPPFEPYLAIKIHSVDIYQRDDERKLYKVYRLEDEALPDGEKRSAKKVAADWAAVEGIPDDVKPIDYNRELTADQKISLASKSVIDRISETSTFLTRNQKLIYPELRIQERIATEQNRRPGEKRDKKKIFSDIDLQTWFYDKDGFIYNKIIDSLVLTVVADEAIEIDWTQSRFSTGDLDPKTLQGFSVQLRLKSNSESANQKWKFTKNGFIVPESHPKMALTSLFSLMLDNETTYIAQGVRMSGDDPMVHYLGVCAQCPASSPFRSRQRWGIRQESGFTIGDWKYSKVENPLWHKLALTWPVDEKGNLIPDLQWPLEGCLMPNAPPLEAPKNLQGVSPFIPIRLQVLKNGERDFSKAVSVVGPDISNLISSAKAPASMYRRLRLPVPEEDDVAQRKLHRMADARQREIKSFLESCTELCNLPFAGRRLFDVSGTEIFDLTSIERDSFVYVTCGENWIDPALSKAEQQRRTLLAYLSHDVRMIQFYCALRNMEGYAVSAEPALQENARLVLNNCGLTPKQKLRVLKGESIEQVMAQQEQNENPSPEPEPKTHHERSHRNVNQRANEKFKWPWEKIRGSATPLDNETEGRMSDLNDGTMDANTSPFSSRKIPKTQLVSMQTFRWESSTGYISCAEDANLVLGVNDIEGKVNDVSLKRRNPDDIFQRWNFASVQNPDVKGNDEILPESFYVVSKARPTMVLTVSLPSCTGNETSEMKINCVGCKITLQQRRYEENGCANQKWSYNPKLGFLVPFASSKTDQEITAANRANVCSYTVNYEALSQPGFSVSILNKKDQAEEVSVCLACSRAMRGRFRLLKIDPNKKFICAIGKREDLKFQGPFHCLNHKVDLTRDEAENTLYYWISQLEKLREEARVRNIARELAAARTVQTIYLLAYRNGDGHTKPGQLLLGSTVTGLLDQATRRLNLSFAARRFYLEDGSVFLTIEDFIERIREFYIDFYKKLVEITHSRAKKSKNSSTSNLATSTGIQRSFSQDFHSGNSNFGSQLHDSSPSKSRNGLATAADIKRAIKPKPMTGSFDVDMNYLLKFPVEVWVSCGEAFVRPTDSDQRMNLRLNQYAQRVSIEHDLELEKYNLRLIKGRRLSSQDPGELVSLSNPDQPVIRKGHWSEKTDAELEKEETVQHLRKSMDGIRESQKPESTIPMSTPSMERLAESHSKIKRVMIYENGRPKDTAVQCQASSLEELMTNAKVILNLMQPVIALFDEHGHQIERFDHLNRDQLVCASIGRVFIRAADKNREIEMKAEWGRTRNLYGPEATNIRVTSSTESHQRIVDPYGPPLLKSSDEQTVERGPALVYSRVPIEPVSTVRHGQTLITELPPSPMTRTDSSSSDDDRETRKSIERPTTANVKRGRVQFSSVTINQESTTSRMTTSSKKSDSDDDEFAAMLRKT